jgi:hypothetical protein
MQPSSAESKQERWINIIRTSDVQCSGAGSPRGCSSLNVRLDMSAR